MTHSFVDRPAYRSMQSTRALRASSTTTTCPKRVRLSSGSCTQSYFTAVASKNPIRSLTLQKLESHCRLMAGPTLIRLRMRLRSVDIC